MICICYDPTPCDDKLRKFAVKTAGKDARVLYRNPRFYRPGDNEEADMVVAPAEFAKLLSEDYGDKVVAYKGKKEK